MGKFLLVLLILVIGAAGGYVGGRILLPELGLEAPGFWIWFWFMCVMLPFILALTFLGEIAKGLDRYGR